MPFNGAFGSFPFFSERLPPKQDERWWGSRETATTFLRHGSPLFIHQQQGTDLTNHSKLPGIGDPALTKTDQTGYGYKQVRGDGYKQVYDKMISDGSECYSAKETGQQLKTGRQGRLLRTSGMRTVTQTQMVG